METSPALLALDWGTSSLRAFLLAADGAILVRRSAERGILRVEEGRFEAALSEIAGDWLAEHAELPVLASGMIGSRQGWREAPYVEAPAGLAELARGLLPVPFAGGRQLWIAPGIAYRAALEAPDVMRGEETQILGVIAADVTSPLVAVLPGTHSKWAIVEGGRISWFATYMTGELYAVLKAHSILGRLMAGEAPDEASFGRGLAEAAAQGARAGGLLHKLFSARSRPLLEGFPETGVASYLSGLLIGSELAEALGAVASRLGAVPGRVSLIGEETLTRLYGRAFAERRIGVAPPPAEAAAQGLLALARAARLLP